MCLTNYIKMYLGLTRAISVLIKMYPYLTKTGSVGTKMSDFVLDFNVWCFFVSPELSSGRDLVIQMSVRRVPSAVRRPWFFVRSISREPYDLPR